MCRHHPAWRRENQNWKRCGDAVKSSGTRRAGWILLDQVASSLTNFALALLVARSVGVEEFGAFSVAFIVYLILVEVLRALSLEPLLIRYSAATREAWSAAVASVLGLAILAGVIIAIPIALVGWGVSGEARGVLFALAVSLPGLLLQDSCRYAFFAAGRPLSAFINDTVWGIVLLTSVVAFSAIGDPTAGSYTLLWGLTGTLAGVLGMWQLGVLPNFRTIRGWLESNRDIAPRFVIEVAAGTGGFYGAFLVVGAIAGLASVGALYAARVLMGPIGVLYLAAASFSVSEGSRHQQRPGMVERFVHRVGALLPAAALLWTAALLLVPENLGGSLLGDSWVEARPVLLTFGIFWATRGAIVGARSGLRIFAAATRSLRSEVVSASLVLVGSAIGAVAAGATGASLALALTGTVGAAFWWFEFQREAATQMALGQGESGDHG